MKKTIRWTAVYETEIEVASDEDVHDRACDVALDVPGSEYQSDTWELLSVRDTDSNP